MSEVGRSGTATRSTKHFEPRLIEIAWFTQQAPETLEASLRWACLLVVSVKLCKIGGHAHQVYAAFLSCSLRASHSMSMLR